MNHRLSHWVLSVTRRFAMLTQYYKFSETQSDPSVAPEVVAIGKWIREFLASPNAQLGRTGPVCPFVPLAIRFDTILIASVPAPKTSEWGLEALQSAVRQEKSEFHSIPLAAAEHSRFRAILLVFPWVSNSLEANAIDQTQRELKLEFVEEGLMLGEFHEWNVTPGLHNQDFKPLRSPVPLLALREMVEQDLPFLHRPTDSPELRIGLLEAYLRVFQKKLAPEYRERALRELSRAQSQLKDAETQGRDFLYPSKNISGSRSRSPSSARLNPTAS